MHHRILRYISSSWRSSSSSYGLRKSIVGVLVGAIGLWCLQDESPNMSLRSSKTVGLTSVDQQHFIVMFSSQEELEQALYPHTLEEVSRRVGLKNYMPKIEFRIAQSCNFTPDCNFVSTSIHLDLLHQLIYTGNTLKVYLPKTPFIPHHLAIVLNRDVRGLDDVTPEENAEIAQMIKKICTIYNTLDIEGPIITQYDQPQACHLGKYVIEILPPPAGYHNMKSVVEKVRANAYILFRSMRLTSVPPIKADPAHYDEFFWSKTLGEDLRLPVDYKNQLPFPHCRIQTGQIKADYYLLQHFFDYLKNIGAEIKGVINHEMIPDSLDYHTVEYCAFDNPDIIARQLIYEIGSAQIFYNLRKGPRPGCNFLILPKEHLQRYAEIPEETLEDMRKLRVALVSVLKEQFPDQQIISFLQDSSAVGQTVPHAHEHIISFDPKTFPLTWTLSFLDSTNKVGQDEMEEQTSKFHRLLESRMNALG